MMEHAITEEDIRDFYDLYNEFISLERDYQHMILGRKEVSQELVKKLELLERMSRLIERGIKTQKYHYENSMKDVNNAKIEDYQKALEVLKELASNETVQYEIKTLTYIAFDSSERHGYRTTEEYTGEITILAEKSSLKEFDSSKKLPSLTQKMLLDIYKQGFSMILVGNDEYMTKRLNIPNKQSLGHYHPMVFYLQDDNLSTAVSSFMNFIEENGPDIEGMEVGYLVQVIKSKYLRSKKLNKKLNWHLGEVWYNQDVEGGRKYARKRKYVWF